MIIRIIIVLITSLFISSCGTSQAIKKQETLDMLNSTTEALHYESIPDYPDTVTQGLLLARMLDGLGYRYYWATNSLTQTDLDYNISEDSRPALETLEHLQGLSKTILNMFEGKANIRPQPPKDSISWEQQRANTLNNIKTASDIARSLNDTQVSDLKIVFKRGDNESSFPLWNAINGPIADAIYHVGQIVSYRRASGNPLDPRVNVFMGKNRN